MSLFTQQIVASKRRTTRSRTGATRANSQPVAWVNTLYWVKRLLALMVLLAVFLLLTKAVEQLRSIPVSGVVLTGYSGVSTIADGHGSNSGASEQELQTLINESLTRGFWQLDLQELKVALESHPWVRQAVVRRQWPNQLSIGIDEYVAVARWNNVYLLSATGDIFLPAKIKPFTHLPLFKVDHQGDADYQMIHQSVTWFNQLQKPLADFGLSVIELTLARSGEFSLLLSNGVTMELGEQDVIRRFSQFLSLLDGPLVGRFANIERVDLRYENGVSIRWRELNSLLDDEFDLAQVGNLN